MAHAFVVLVCQPLYASDVVVNYAEAGRLQLAQKNYDEAIDLLRTHLRQSPTDYNTWNLLATAYYYSGQPRRALRYFKHVEHLAAPSAYNFYHQGLCYEALAPAALDAVEPADLLKAKQYFALASQRFNDEYSARATYEVGVLEYLSHNKAAARHWLTRYQSQFPKGSYVPQVNQLLQSLQENRWLTNIEGTKKPNMEVALFKYNKLSLGPLQHYWFTQGGFQYAEVAAQEPKARAQISSSDNRFIAMLANAGVGIGPIREDEITLFAGYSYKQTWDSNSDRLNRWVESPTDLDTFPFQADLLLRRHQIYGDFRRDFHKTLFIGVFGRLEYARVGSTYFPSADSPMFRKTLDQGQIQLLIPWIGIAYWEHFRTLFYLYMNKQLVYNSPEFSNKSDDFGLSSKTPTMSLGISHAIDLPRYDLAIDIELFRYEFIYNDPWLDYNRQGIFIGVEQDFLQHWTVAGIGGYYSDRYVFPRVKSYNCNTLDNTPTDQFIATSTPRGCNRNDTGTLYQLGLYWNRTQFQRVSMLIQYISNENADQKEFNQSTKNIQLMYTLAFPSVKRVSRFVDRFADAAFTKGGKSW